MGEFIPIAFRELSFNVNYTVFVKHTIDIKTYQVSNPNFSKFSDYIGHTVKIRLLEIQYNLKQLVYINIIAGEYNQRNVISYSTDLPEYLFEGVQIKDQLVNNVKQSLFTQNKVSENFGQGIIIDDFSLPSTIFNVIIDSNPPVNNDTNSLTIKIKLKYNHNYSELEI